MSETHEKAASSAEIFCCMGTRPEIIKLAPLVYAMRAAGLQVRIVNSSQHESDITSPLYDFFNLQVDVHFHLEQGGELGALNARLLAAYTELFAARHPVAVVVQGDTSSALQAAQAAFLQHIPVAHVEAGLRTHDLLRPFPEELNRTLIARMAQWHFAPTQRAAQALIHEGVQGVIEVVGNTVVDAALWGEEQVSKQLPAGVSEELRVLFGTSLTLLVTAHRRENWGGGIERITASVRRALLSHDNLACVWVLHPNPVVAGSVRAAFADLPKAVERRLRLIPPQNYAEMLWMMKHAWVLLTDSGGIQEEAVTLRLPVLVARDETERPEVVECGTGQLVGTDPQRIWHALESLYGDAALYARMKMEKGNPYGDGKCAHRIAARIAADLMPRGHGHEHDTVRTA